MTLELKRDMTIWVGAYPNYPSYIYRIMFVNHTMGYGGEITDKKSVPFLHALGITIRTRTTGRTKVYHEFMGCTIQTMNLKSMVGVTWQVSPEVQAFYDTLPNHFYTSYLTDDLDILKKIVRLKDGITGEPEGEAILVAGSKRLSGVE